LDARSFTVQIWSALVEMLKGARTGIDEGHAVPLWMWIYSTKHAIHLEECSHSAYDTIPVAVARNAQFAPLTRLSSPAISMNPDIRDF